MKTMRASHWLIDNALQATLVATLVLNVAPGVAAQSAKATRPAAARGQAAKAPGGPQEGIKVHGHWVIEVRNPDGGLVTRREFNNALVGADALVRVLSRTNSAGRWVISFSGGSSSTPSPCTGGTCVITEGTGAVLFSNEVLVGTDLTLVPTTAAPANLVLKGSGTVPASGTIGSVLTWFGLCPNSVAPQSPCQYVGPTGGFLFTGASAPAKFTAAPVVAGQIVQITVTFTFS